MKSRRTVGVFFGGTSPEHEVSVISGLQAVAALDRSRWTPVAVYIGKDGSWWTGPELADPSHFGAGFQIETHAERVAVIPGSPGRMVLAPIPKSRWRRPERIVIDVVLPVLHGGSGEDGGLQGLCEVVGVPYAGSGLLAASLAMDKVAAKDWCRAHDIPSVPSLTVSENEWAGNEGQWLDRFEKQPGLPAIVKPARLGSSIGISLAADRSSLDDAIEEAFRYDENVLVERAVTNLRELNCSVAGTPDDAAASVLEEPVSGDELLSFTDKYLSGSGSKQEGMASLDRHIPAPVSDQMTEDVRALAVRIFRAFGCAGVVRIDFLLDESDGTVYFNEINTIPGSLSFYLWEPTGVPFSELLSRVLDAGLAAYRARTGRVRSYDVNLLSEKDLGGLKGSKS